MSPSPESPLRARTYLAPGLPLELFEAVCAWIAQGLGREVVLAAESRHSGPMHSHHDPFEAGEVDLGFLCSPSYLHLRSKPRPSVELVPAGMVFDDVRAEGDPRYFSEVVVRASSVLERFEDLEGCVWGYNDTCSLSGYFSARQKLRAIDRLDTFFEREVDTGSHLRSVQAIVQRDIDAAAIDSNVLARLFEEVPALANELRVIATWGSYPIQPLVLRRELARELARPIATTLLALDEEPARRRRMAELGLLGFGPLGAEDYEEERCEMLALGLIA